MTLAGPIGNICLGDVIRLSGYSVPPDLEGKYFVVEDRDHRGDWVLSCPYWDEACERRYHPPVPRNFKRGVKRAS